MAMQTQYITNSRGNRLYVRVYQPAVQLRGFIVFHHGYGAFTALYDPVYQMWADSGVCVVAYDAQGFGNSKTDNRKLHAYVSDMQQLADDLIQIRQEVVDVKQQQRKLPVFVAGQSMGGLIATLAALRDQTRWQGLMLISPSLDAERTFVSSILEKLQGIALLLCPNARIVPSPPFEQCTDVPELVPVQDTLLSPGVCLDVAAIFYCSCKARSEKGSGCCQTIFKLHRFRTDPLMEHGSMRVKTGGAFLKGFADVRHGESALSLPILLVSSPTDTIISVPAIKRFLGNVQSKVLTVAWIEGAMHEIFLGRFEAESRGPTVQWLLQHT